MSENNQETIEDLLDELSDVVDKGWNIPLTGGKTCIDGEEARQILDEIREVIPEDIRKAKAIVADRDKIIADAQREADTVVRVAEEKAKALVNQEEVVRQAQAKANDLIMQGQAKFRDMRKASNDYIDDLMRKADDSLAQTLAELRKTRQNIKSTQRTGTNQ
jgi:erythromycin esterase-like protein